MIYSAYQGKARGYEPLQRLYEEHGLPNTDPATRARFLAEDVMQFTMTDHDLVMRTAHEKGRAEGLLQIEDILIANHQISDKETISVPLDLE